MEAISTNRPMQVWNMEYTFEAPESVMCDVIRLKRRIAARSGKGNQPKNIKTAVGAANFKAKIIRF